MIGKKERKEGIREEKKEGINERVSADSINPTNNKKEKLIWNIGKTKIYKMFHKL